jgi:uncharacterized membrane protein YkvA (DUF1232 family)
MKKQLESLKQRALNLKRETYALYLAYRDPRVPWYAKVICACTVAYALSPIDLIPDFIPVIGYLDDLVIVPAGLSLAIRLIPHDVLCQCREKAKAEIIQKGPKNYIAATIIIAIWIGLAAVTVIILLQALRE